jgi:hypothetical protein
MAADGKAPATKIGRAWVFPCHLFDMWLSGTLPKPPAPKKQRPEWPALPYETLAKAVEKLSAGGVSDEEPEPTSRTVSYSAIRGRQRRLATPNWVDRAAIKKIYTKARDCTRKTRIPHCVDHIVPLIHPLVCGLHVHYNMRVITGSANSSKGNRFTDHG